MSDTLDKLTRTWQHRSDLLQVQRQHRSICVTDPKSTLCDFSSNDYLGISTDTRLAEAAFAWAERYGSGAKCSRVVWQHATDLNQIEGAFADWVGFPAGLLFPSGFSANLAILDALAPMNGESANSIEVFLDHRAHASLYAACRLSGIAHTTFRHNDYHFLSDKLALSNAEFKIVIIEALHSMDGTWEEAGAIKDLCQKHHALLVVDEAHSIGITGPRGAGWLAAHPELKPFVVAAMFGCGKALGVQGGFVVGSPELLDRMVQKSRTLIYSTGLSPLLAGAVSAAVAIAVSAESEIKRLKLLKNITYAWNGLSELSITFDDQYLFGVPNSPILGLRIAKAEQLLLLSEALFKKGFIVRPIRPPTVPRNTSRLRIVLRSSHSESEIDGLIQAIKESLK